MSTTYYFRLGYSTMVHVTIINESQTYIHILISPPPPPANYATCIVHGIHLISERKKNKLKSRTVNYTNECTVLIYTML